MFERVKKGFNSLTTLQLVRGKLWGTAGNVVGLCFAAVYLVIKGFWYTLPVIGFTMFLQVIEFISVYKQYASTLEFEKAVKGLV